MKHQHFHKESSAKKALGFAIWISLAILIFEVAGGIWTNSLALLSDATHVFMDLLSFAFTYMAIRLAEEPVSDTRTFGCHRIEVIAALTNALTVGIAAIFIFFQSIKRIAVPQEVLASEMLVIAILGLIGNLLVIWKLHPHSSKDLNVRSAFLHAFGDAAASVAVTIGGILIMKTGKTFIDPISAMVVAFILLVGAYKIFIDSIHILMEGAPKEHDLKLIQKAIEEIAGKESVIDLHIWSLCSHLCSLTLHLALSHEQMNRQKEILHEINSCLDTRFNITHTTIQIESKDWHIKI